MHEKILSQFEKIADELANDGISVIDDFLSKEEVTNITNTDEFKNGLLRFKKAGIGKQQEKQIKESIRGDYIQWIDQTNTAPQILLYLERLSQLMAFLNQSLFLSLKDLELHMTIYPTGSFYKRHLDQFKKDDHRKLSVICYLNENWLEDEGGQLRVYFPTEMKDFFPTAGRLVCFRSDQLEHEVLPATRERLSLTGWFVDKEIDLKHL
ncbi:MAG TPA: 2OG-Fe(II) oxygenase [Cyclobacteriaceae bacterium]|jgi:SM-20-related protein|nr:2OG-Fe(II) oxygenase [Cyclobacteriaceae bacterium]